MNEDFEADAYCWCERLHSDANALIRHNALWSKRIHLALLACGAASLALGAAMWLSCCPHEQHITKRVYWPEASSMLQVNGRRAYQGVTRP